MGGENVTTVLLVGDYGDEDESVVRTVCGRLRCRFSRAADWRQARQLLKVDSPQVVISPSDGPAWDWKDILDRIRRLASRPHLIVTSRLADERLWAEVLNLGGYDVLAQPLDRDEAERVVASAARHSLSAGSGWAQCFTP
jgi:DNA-binding NtrC family response regulator